MLRGLEKKCVIYAYCNAQSLILQFGRRQTYFQGLHESLRILDEVFLTLNKQLAQ